MTATINSTAARLIFLVIVTVLVYANSLSVPFIFDDFVSIVNNPAITNISAITDDDVLDDISMLPDLRNSIKLRTFSYITFAVNHLFNGLDPTGYHVVNILIHAVNVCLVYLLTMTLMSCSSRCITGPPARAGSSRDAGWTALVVAVLFAVHPVQTSAVTYITQRFTSLAALLYLLSLVFYTRSRCTTSNGKSVAYLLLSFMTTMLAMDTKEIAFTIPIVLTAIELMFFTGRLSRRLLTLVPFYLTMLVIPLTLWSISANDKDMVHTILDATNLMNLDKIPRASYLFTQFRVVVTYLRILIFPVNLNFDYNYHVFRSFFDPQVISSFAVIVMIFCAGIYFLVRAQKLDDPRSGYFRVSAFGIFWFIITLSMTSSIIPINDVINEYRLYLPSVGFLLFLTNTIGVYWSSTPRALTPVYRKGGSILCGAVICALALTTVARNHVYQDRQRLWEDVVRKSPGKLRSSYILSNIYLSRNMPDAAIATLQDLIRLNPRLGKPHYYLGSAYLQLQRFEDALAEFQLALAVRRDKAEIYVGLTEAYLALGKTALAVDALEKVIQLEPNNTAVPRLQNRISQQSFQPSPG